MKIMETFWHAWLIVIFIMHITFGANDNTVELGFYWKVISRCNDTVCVCCNYGSQWRNVYWGIQIRTCLHHACSCHWIWPGWCFVTWHRIHNVHKNCLYNYVASIIHWNIRWSPCSAQYITTVLPIDHDENRCRILLTVHKFWHGPENVKYPLGGNCNFITFCIHNYA